MAFTPQPTAARRVQDFWDPLTDEELTKRLAEQKVTEPGKEVIGSYERGIAYLKEINAKKEADLTNAPNFDWSMDTP